MEMHVMLLFFLLNYPMVGCLSLVIDGHTFIHGCRLRWAIYIIFPSWETIIFNRWHIVLELGRRRWHDCIFCINSKIAAGLVLLQFSFAFIYLLIWFNFVLEFSICHFVL
jgi:hypothetical protein